jgi:YVTN family beta-propeller protein
MMYYFATGQAAYALGSQMLVVGFYVRIVSAFAIVSAALLTATAAHSQGAGRAVLALEAKIPLGNVAGRIDHLAIDLARRRLFVAELGNNTVGVVDLNSKSVVHRISGLSEPQGVAYLPVSDTLYVASGGDGSLRLYRGAEYASAGKIDLGSDADNIRIDAEGEKLLVGYGSGALALVDAATNQRIAAYPLKAHPESFQIDGPSNRIFVNLPSVHAIAVLDRSTGKELASWPMRHGGNFAMALDHDGARVFTVFRSPSKLASFSFEQDAAVAEVDACGDADDVFLDAKRKRLYVSCGAGFVDVFGAEAAPPRRLARLASVDGARTSLFVPELDRLYVAVRARMGQGAAIWVYRPSP